MDDFEKKINEIDKESLKIFLLSLKKPCYESELLKKAIKDINIMECDSLTLYQSHFILYNILYKLKDEFHKDNKYLHVHFMRTFLIDYPDKGKCFFYNEDLFCFCKNECKGENNYCDFHLKRIGSNNIDMLSEKYFYLDKNNYYKLNKETAEAFLSGTWEILAKFDDFKKSFKILNLPESADLNTIKRQFKYLAKKYHPDTGEASNKFYEINNAYRFLMKYYSIKI